MADCAVNDCDKQAHAKGLCHRHYMINWRYGDPNANRYHRSLEEKFWDFVDRRSAGECWMWKGGGGKYGQLMVHGERIGAHRASYVLAYGPIPPGLFVLHSCDKPGCVNPAHLSVGTPQDNTDDMLRKGRRVLAAARGEAAGLAKLTEGAVREIRKRQSESPTVIGRDFGVDPNTIRAVLSGKTWRHVT